MTPLPTTKWPAAWHLHAVSFGALAGSFLVSNWAPGSCQVGLSVLSLGVASALVLAGLRVAAWPRAWVSAAAFVLAALATRVPSPPQVTGGPVIVSGLVVGVGPRGERSREASVYVDVTHVESAPADTVQADDARAPSARAEPRAARRSVEGPSRVLAALSAAPGDRVSFRATLTSALGFRNAGPHPDFPRATDLAIADDVLVLERAPAHDPAAALARTRAHVRARLDATLDPDAAGLVRALVLGDAGSLDESDAESTRRAGLSHVVAVSGMHVTLVVGALVALVAALGRRIAPLAMRVDPRRVAWAAGIVLAPMYAAFAGGSPSAWRAAATSSIVWGLAVVGRRADPLAVTSLVVVVACVATPGAVQSPAFVLSVAATAAVLDPIPMVSAPSEAPDRLAWLRSALRASVRASIATAPLTLWCFATLSPLSALANVVVVPIVAAVLLPLGTLHALVACVSVELAALTAWPTELVVRAFLALATFFGDLGAGVPVPPPDGVELLILGGLAAALLTTRRPAHVALACASCALALVGAEAHLRHRESLRGALRVTFLDVGQGDGALLDMPDGSLWLIDAGGASFGSHRDPGELAIAPLLRARRRDRIDVAVITHPHPDHHGGFSALARSVVIGEVWDSGQAAEEQPHGAWERAFRGMLVPVHSPETLCGSPRTTGGARIDVLWPCPRFDPGWDANENSLVLRVSFGRRSFLFLGDAEQHTERTLAPSLRHVDVLKVGHHGSRTSSTPELVDATRPWLAVISAGPGNRYGHPHADVLERWEARADHVVRTDLEGSVTVWTDGNRLEASTWSGRALAAPMGRELLGRR